MPECKSLVTSQYVLYLGVYSHNSAQQLISLGWKRITELFQEKKNSLTDFALSFENYVELE